MYTTPPRSAGMFIRSKAADFPGKLIDSRTRVFSKCRTAPNTAKCKKLGLRPTGGVSLSTHSCVAGDLSYAIFATQTVYCHPESANRRFIRHFAVVYFLPATHPH
eukprot:3560402-Prymnesium_polylepis.1